MPHKPTDNYNTRGRDVLSRVTFHSVILVKQRHVVVYTRRFVQLLVLLVCSSHHVSIETGLVCLHTLVRETVYVYDCKLKVCFQSHGGVGFHLLSMRQKGGEAGRYSNAFERETQVIVQLNLQTELFGRGCRGICSRGVDSGWR